MQKYTPYFAPVKNLAKISHNFPWPLGSVAMPESYPGHTVSAYEEYDEVDTGQRALADATICDDTVIHNFVPVLSGQDLKPWRNQVFC